MFTQNVLSMYMTFWEMMDSNTESGLPLQLKTGHFKCCSWNWHFAITTSFLFVSFTLYVCDTILLHTMEWFSFTNHLVSADLMQADRFEQYTVAFPEEALWRPIQCSTGVSWRQSLVSSTASRSSEPVVVLWTYSSCLWRTILKKYFQRLFLS